MDAAVCVVGGLVRAAQAAIEAAPTVLCGLVMSGVLRRMVGPAGMTRLFGTGGWGSRVRAWGLGMLLPVCSLGVIPVARELRRAGVRNGTVLAFVLAAPLVNPLSLLYGLTLAEPGVILCFVSGSLVVALAAGWLGDRLFPAVAPDPDAGAALPPPGPQRLAAVAATAARELTGPALGYWLVALLGVAALAAAVPAGALQRTMAHDDPWSPLLMAAVAVPVYDPPMKAMMQLGLMFEHGNSVGAAFVLFTLGAGVNLGTLVWAARWGGARRVAGWALAVVALTALLGYAAEPVLYAKEHPEEHTHAFDDFSNPFHPQATTDLWATARAKVGERVQPFEATALAGLALLAVLNLALRIADRRGAVEEFLTRPRPAPTRPLSAWERPLPGHLLALAAFAGLAAFAVVGAYVYYPAPRDVFKEMSQVRAEAFSAVAGGQREDAVREIGHWDLLSRKLQVGVVLRTGGLPDNARQRAEELREGLEELRDLVLAGRLEEARARRATVERLYRECRSAYLGG